MIALRAGFYGAPIIGMKERHPKIQLLTVEELLQGKRIDYPAQTNVTFKKAPKAKQKGRRQTRLGEQPADDADD